MMWWDNLESKLDDAIKANNQLRADKIIIAAYEAQRMGKITFRTIDRLNAKYEAWEKTWID